MHVDKYRQVTKDESPCSARDLCGFTAPVCNTERKPQFHLN